MEDRDADCMRDLAKQDLFFLLTVICNRSDINRDWLYDRCREVEAEPDGCLDLWSREHYKSTLLTYGLSIKDILNNPNVTIGIFSHTRPIAKAFLSQIKTEFQNNQFLKGLFPEIFYQKPQSEADKWSLDRGIVVKRDSNAKESTVEAWGLVDGQPTALCIDTPVLTTKGWKHHGDLEAGDYVFGEDGNPVEVIYNSGTMNGKLCTKVIFDDTEIIAADDHLWGVDRVYSPRDPITRRQDTGWKHKIREIVKTRDLPLSNGPNRDKRRRIPMTPILSFENNEKLLIDPYVLGLWLGDGSSAQQIITTGDYEILEDIRNAGYEVSVAQDRGSYKMFTIHGLHYQLKHLFLLKNKHIPIEYLRSDAASRLALFQGLMDSDGSCRSGSEKMGGYGQCTFCNCNQILIEQTHYLACSLAMKPGRISEHHDGHPNHRSKFSFRFTGVKTNPPFRLKRKLDLCIEQKVKTGRYVRCLERVDSVPVNCIQVASDNGMYLAGKSLVPTHNSKHFSILVYDDVVTKESVTTPEQIKKTTEAWELSLNLGSEGGVRRYIGTRYHSNDTYRTMMTRGSAKVRKYPATDNGRMDGNPVLMTKETLDEKLRDMGSFTFSAQMLQDPLQDNIMGFKKEWLRYYKSLGSTDEWNRYLLVDPASEKKKSSDYTVIMVIGLAPDNNYYLLDGIRDRLNLTEKTERLFEFHRKWKPTRTGYEKYGMQADIEHIQYVMDQENYRFDIQVLGGTEPKVDRIRKLVPIFENHRFWMPEHIHFRDYHNHAKDLIKVFIEDEFETFPVSAHDDMLDCMARIVDPILNAKFPLIEEKSTFEFMGTSGSWMG